MSLRRLPRPNTRTTPLQRALCHLGEALRIARTDARTWATFLEIVGIVVARENAQKLDEEPRL